MPDRVATALAHVAARSHGAALDPTVRVTCSFHPDRLTTRADEWVIESLVHSGVYLSQFVTATSNGGLTAHPGGDRFRWESVIFGEACDGGPVDLRPKYGALNHRHRPFGASPRFGSSYIRLAAHTLRRTTFCFPDSSASPTAFGTMDRCGLTDLADAAECDPLDDYVEAHVHGHIDLRTDVEAIVLDPSFRGTRVERAVNDAPCPVEWHEGFVADVRQIGAHPHYRGAEVVRLAEAAAEGGRLVPRMIGDLARSGRHDPQRMKQVWHCTARFGVAEWGETPPACRD